MLFGKNTQTDIVLAVLGLKESDIERFRDCGIDFDNKQIYVYTRTGGGNRDDYPNENLTSSPYYLWDEDDNYDSTYATYYFKFPDEIAGDMQCLQNPRKHGYTSALIQWLVKTIEREPTKGDKRQSLYEGQSRQIEQLRRDGIHVTIWNGHTIVPLSDYGMDILLRIIEQDGEFLPYSVRPYEPKILLNAARWNFDEHKPSLEQERAMVVISSPGKWITNQVWWERWKKKFGEKYPKAIAKLKRELGEQ